jgi:hypothetical protein
MAMKKLLVQSTNIGPFTPPVNIDSDYKDIFVKFNYDSNDYQETKGKYSFFNYFSNGFSGGDIVIKNLDNGEILEINGYNNKSGIFRYKLADIEFSFKYYINNEVKIISKKFYFKNALNFSNQSFESKFITDKIKPILYNGYLKIAYNKSVSDFDAHIYYCDDQEHDLNVGCYCYKDLDINTYNPRYNDFTVYKLNYNDPKLGLIVKTDCVSMLWPNVTCKAALINNPKIFYELFFKYKKLRESFKQKGINPYPFRLHYENPIIKMNSLIIDYYD